MPKFRVYYQATVSASVAVEAQDEQEARVKADEVFEQPPDLCHQCSNDVGELSDWEQSEGDWAVRRVDA